MKPIELTYLACPFRHEDPVIMKKRCAAAHYVTAKLSSQGRHIFSPLTHNEVLVDLCPNIPGEYWMQFDLTILSMCQCLLILTMEGWEASKGVQREIVLAKQKGLLIETITPPEESAYASCMRSFA